MNQNEFVELFENANDEVKTFIYLLLTITQQQT